jgi:hypothetical protein
VDLCSSVFRFLTFAFKQCARQKRPSGRFSRASVFDCGIQSHRADVPPMLGAKTLGMGLENIDEQLHSSSHFDLPRQGQSSFGPSPGESFILIGHSLKNQAAKIHFWR